MTDEERAVNIAKIRASLDKLPPADRAELVEAMERCLDISFAERMGLMDAEAAVKAGDATAATALLQRVQALAPERERWLRKLRAHQADVEVSLGGKSLAENLRRLLAETDLQIVLDNRHVSPAAKQFIMSIGPDDYPTQWAAIKASVRDVADAHIDVTCDEEHLLAYVRMVVAHQTARNTHERSTVDITADLEQLELAMGDFYRTHIKPTGEPPDYAGGLLDVRQRVLTGARCADHIKGAQLENWLGDIDLFYAPAGRHEYTYEQVREVLAALSDAMGPISARRADIAREVARLKALLARYQSGPAHMLAIEQQWLAYKVNKALLARFADTPMADRGALQPTTCEALARADAYCWAPTTVEAVATVASGLQGDCYPSPVALGDLAFPAVAGWWWFQEPIPVQTLRTSADDYPVVALLWRREHPRDDVPRIWLQTLVSQVIEVDGRPQAVCMPTAAWVWADGLVLDGLPDELRAGFSHQYNQLRHGEDSVGIDVAVSSALWFSRFFLAAAMWLRQRVVMATPGQGIRQVARQLQREHKLPITPSVQIIELRRRETASRVSAPASDGAPKREYSCRWVVHGFTRNQWYPREGVHAPKWIEAYDKGPADKPFKATTRVYAVRR